MEDVVEKLLGSWLRALIDLEGQWDLFLWLLSEMEAKMECSRKGHGYCMYKNWLIQA